MNHVHATCSSLGGALIGLSFYYQPELPKSLPGQGMYIDYIVEVTCLIKEYGPHLLSERV